MAFASSLLVVVCLRFITSLAASDGGETFDCPNASCPVVGDILLQKQTHTEKTVDSVMESEDVGRTAWMENAEYHYWYSKKGTNRCDQEAASVVNNPLRAQSISIFTEDACKTAGIVLQHGSTKINSRDGGGWYFYTSDTHYLQQGCIGYHPKVVYFNYGDTGPRRRRHNAPKVVSMVCRASRCGSVGNINGAAMSGMPIQASSACNCAKECATTPGCQAWSWRLAGTMCWLRSDVGTTRDKSFADTVSGDIWDGVNAKSGHSICKWNQNLNRHATQKYKYMYHDDAADEDFESVGYATVSACTKARCEDPHAVKGYTADPCPGPVYKELKSNHASGWCTPYFSDGELCKTGSAHKASSACAGSLWNGYNYFGPGYNDVEAQRRCNLNTACVGYTKSHNNPGYYKLKSKIDGVSTGNYECWKK